MTINNDAPRIAQLTDHLHELDKCSDDNNEQNKAEKFQFQRDQDILVSQPVQRGSKSQHKNNGSTQSGGCFDLTGNTGEWAHPQKCR
jgi:hypothetical protein